MARTDGSGAAECAALHRPVVAPCASGCDSCAKPLTSKGKMQKKAMGMKIVSAYPAHTCLHTSLIWPCADCLAAGCAYRQNEVAGRSVGDMGHPVELQNTSWQGQLSYTRRLMVLLQSWVRCASARAP